ncbi:MAG: DUF6352 family protein [Burkholderiales bacterium]
MTLDPSMPDFWPASGFPQLHPTPDGWLQPTAAWLRPLFERPELALVDESCAAERALHAALVEAPLRAVSGAELAAVEDSDARSNYAAFLAFRDGLVAAGSLEAWYLAQMRSGQVATPPPFIARAVEAIVRGLLHDRTDAFEARAAELLFRPQRVSRTEGRLLSADLAAVDLLNETAGLGDLGRLLVQGNAPLRAIDLAVLSPENAADYWRRAARHEMLLDLTHEVTNDVGHGLVFTLTRTHSGLAALSRVLQRWIAHFLGVTVTITPLQRIDDAAWRWHIGLDVESMALLNDLYEDRSVDPARLERLISLFRLDFENPADMHPDVAGHPVYLGLATAPDGTLRLKPQNLLLNLPLAPEA